MGSMRDEQVGGLDSFAKNWLWWLLAFLLVYFLPLGVRPLVLPDEFRYAEIPREILAKGDWVIPTLNGLRYFEKPIFGYWLGAISEILFGPTPFAVRFMPALTALLSGLTICWLVTRAIQSFGLGVLTAVIFLTSLMVLGMGSISTLDSELTFFLTLSLAAYYFAYINSSSKERFLWQILSGLACGLAFMTKGFLVYVVIAAVIGPFLLWEKRWKDLVFTWWIPLIASVLITLPWALAIHAREPEFWNFFFWNEHVRRFLAEDAQHAAPFYFYLPMLAWGALPWLMCIPAALSGLKNSKEDQTLFRFAVCWFVIPFLFFSASKGKLPPYILPCLAPLSVLLALGLRNYLLRGERKLFDYGSLSLATALVLAMIALAMSQLTTIFGEDTIEGGEGQWQCLLIAAVLGLWILGLIFSRRTNSSEYKLVWFALAPLPLLFAIHVVTPITVLEKRAPQAFLESMASHVRPDTILISDSKFTHAVAWVYKRHDVFVALNPGEMEYGLSYPEARMRNLPDAAAIANFLSQNKGRHPIVMVLKPGYWDSIKAALPSPVAVEARKHAVFVEY